MPCSFCRERGHNIKSCKYLQELFETESEPALVLYYRSEPNFNALYPLFASVLLDRFPTFGQLLKCGTSNLGSGSNEIPGNETLVACEPVAETEPDHQHPM